jgi:hypothetical protein
MSVKRKIQAPLFFGGAAVLRPATARASGAIKGDAGGGRHATEGVEGEALAHAQLVGLAQHCDVRVCITSWLPVTVRLASSCCICSTLCGRRSFRAPWARRGGTHTMQQLAAASAAAAPCMPVALQSSKSLQDEQVFVGCEPRTGSSYSWIVAWNKCSDPMQRRAQPPF